jgi:predicted nucleic acid-binding protein
MYDAIYVWQAMRGGVTLATRDGGLLTAAGRNRIPVRDLR